jgi:hypothetical protein
MTLNVGIDPTIPDMKCKPCDFAQDMRDLITRGAKRGDFQVGVRVPAGAKGLGLGEHFYVDGIKYEISAIRMLGDGTMEVDGVSVDVVEDIPI